jgi:succinoglycan biosynthesis transport protein ExoP
MTSSEPPDFFDRTTRVHQGAEDEIDLMALARTLWRGKWWILLTTLIALFVGGYYAFRVAVPVYTARAVVALESRQEQVVDIESVMSGLSGDQATINTEVEVLRSRHLAKKLVLELGLLGDPEFNAELRERETFSLDGVRSMLRGVLGSAVPSQKSDEAILEATTDRLIKAVTISNIRQSYVFNITAVTTSPQKSAAIANKLANLYILDQLETKFDATEQATNWLTDRVSQLKDELEQAEADVKAFNARTELISAEVLEAMNRQLKDLRDRITEAETSSANAEEQLRLLSSAQATGSLESMAGAAQDRTLDRVMGMIAQGTTDQEAFDSRYSQIVDRARLERDRAMAQIDTLESSVRDLEARIGTQSTDLVELQQLQREAEASRLIYEYFLGRLKETSVQQGIQQADSRILSDAVVPTSPSAPRKSLILAMSVIVGSLAGAAAVLLYELTQNTYRTAEELEASTGYTVMGTVPKVPAKDRAMILEYVLEKPTSQAAEAVRNLRTSIMLSNVDNPPKVVMSTSSLPSEGKTTQSLLLAQNVAALGKRVLLIEGDIRRRVFTKYLDVSSKRGLVSILAGEAGFEEVVQHVDRLGVDVLIGEKPKVNAADLYASEKFAAFLREVRNRYDLIVIDTPPVLVVPDARVIGKQVDAVIYAVKWDATAKTQVAAGLNMFESVGVKVTGLVLSQVDPKGLKRYGYGEYGSYNYYSSYYDN